MIVKPTTAFNGEFEMPGDKSISHRAVILASLANGCSTVENFATGEDCHSTIRCMRSLGVEIEQDKTTLKIQGVGLSGLKQTAALDCGNSGTTIRLLAGVLAGQNFTSILSGDESLMRRPMQRIIEPLTFMGAEVKSENGCAPLTINGKKPLTSIRYEMPVASAQVKSCILLAGLNAAGETTVIEQGSTRDHTERMLRWFGADIEVFEKNDRRNTETLPPQKTIVLQPDRSLTARNMIVPGDISSAVFFIVAAAVIPGSHLLIRNVGINKTRSKIIDVLRRFGTDIEIANLNEVGCEPFADIRVRGGLRQNNGVGIRQLDADVIPSIIDEIPILAVLGTQLEGGLEIRDAAELRFKESDRIGSIVENLKRIGADVIEFDDGFRVGRSRLNGAVVDSFGDHRIAMAFAVAGLMADGETEISGSECSDISFPEFFQLLSAASV